MKNAKKQGISTLPKYYPRYLLTMEENHIAMAGSSHYHLKQVIITINSTNWQYGIADVMEYEI